MTLKPSDKTEPKPNRDAIGGVAIFALLALGACGYFGYQEWKRRTSQADQILPLPPQVQPFAGEVNGTLIVKTGVDNYEVQILQSGQTVVAPTLERWFILPAGEFDLVVHDPASGRVVSRKHFELAPRDELILDASADAVFPQPEEPGAVRSVAE